MDLVCLLILLALLLWVVFQFVPGKPAYWIARISLIVLLVLVSFRVCGVIEMD